MPEILHWLVLKPFITAFRGVVLMLAPSRSKEMRRQQIALGITLLSAFAGIAALPMLAWGAVSWWLIGTAAAASYFLMIVANVFADLVEQEMKDHDRA